MAWQDRDYNAGREEMNSFFASPANFLRWSVPIYKSHSFYIRLHFWFLLTILFNTIYILQTGQPYLYIPLDFATLLLAVLFHEFGHRVFALFVGGNHWEWLVWPLGGMIPPSSPKNPKSLFVANIGGIAFSFPLAVAAFLALRVIPNIHIVGPVLGFNLFDPVAVIATHSDPALNILAHFLAVLCTYSAAITIVNLFPAYWFDGGLIWQSILTPRAGVWKATLMTCTAGMVLSVPFFFLTLWHQDFLGMVVFALLFSDCFNRRRVLRAAGPGVMDEDEVSYNYMGYPDHPQRRKIKKRWIKKARKRALAEQAEQAKIDNILAKVKDKGLHSLTWWEKRTLKKATERQRQQDLAERL